MPSFVLLDTNHFELVVVFEGLGFIETQKKRKCPSSRFVWLAPVVSERAPCAFNL